MRQTPTDIMHDPTLRPGDAYMTASGLKIFTGDISDVHDESDFTPLAGVHFLKKSERIRLAELDPAQSALPVEVPRPVVRRSASNPGHRGPAAEIAQASITGTVRYVGP